MKKSASFIFFTILTWGVPKIDAQISLPQIVRDSMVLQRNEPINIWGWAGFGEEVTVDFNGKQHKGHTTDTGVWRIQLPALPAGGPYEMRIKGRFNTILLKEILIGDIWLCAGQSNMVHQLDIHDVLYAEEIVSADFSEIRQFRIPASAKLDGPQQDVSGGFWQAAVKENVRPFSAVAYFFAKKIYEKYQVPIGLINASVGGTPIEAWTSTEGLKEFPSLVGTIETNKDSAYVNHINTIALTSQRDYVNSLPQDKGMMEVKRWYETDYQPDKWRRINIPGYWEDQGIHDLDGVVWYRKEIVLPDSMAGKPAKVFMGRIVDADILYINGTKVGEKTYQYPQRRYNVPAHLLKAGKNLFVIRVTNYQAKGGFVPDKPYCLLVGGDTIDLKGYWHYKVGAVFTPRAPAPPSISLQNQPASLYNGMVAPITNYRLKGMLWYQGESNVSRPRAYADLLPTLIEDWRSKFNMPDAPFIFAQLPNYLAVNYLPEESDWAILRESQASGLKMSNTAMTVNIDLGEWNDIHPDNKKDVGERLALAALKIAYDEPIVFSGPIYQSHKIDGEKIIISFEHVGSGLVARDGGELSEFAIAGADGKFVWAEAKIHGNEVIVWSETVPDPLYVRYAWADNPNNPNLFNQEGLPAAPFRTDGH